MEYSNKNSEVGKPREEIKKLAKRCLKFKWIADQSKDLKRLLSLYIFCFNIFENRKKGSCCKVFPIEKSEEKDLWAICLIDIGIFI